ncbi:MAG: fatty acid desaturase family protein [Bdellovibrionales bacterium]
MWKELAAGFLYSIFIFRAFAFMHECVHSSVRAQKWVNTAFGEVYGIFSFLPFKSWRALHLDHHRWAGNVEKDPSMKILLGFERRGFKTAKIVSWSWKYWIPFLGFMQHLVFWTATVSKKEYVFIVGSLVYVGAAGWFLGPVAFGTGLLSYLYLVEIINFPHHLGMVQQGGESRFPTLEQHHFTRSCVYPRWLAHGVFLNFNLHTEHHLYPSHPWYLLDAIHAELVASGESFNFSQGNDWILRNRRLPVEQLFLKTFKHSDDKAA